MASSTDPPLMLSRRTSGLNFCRWLGCSLPWAPAPHRSPHHHGACRSCAPCSSTHTRRADRVGSRRCAQTRSCPGRRVCRLPAGRRRPHAVQPRRRRRIVHRGAADRGTGVRAGPDALLRPRRRAPADRPKPAGHPLVATRVGATLLGLGVLLTALAVVGVVCGCARTLTGAGGSRFTGGAAPLRADLLALGIDLFGRGLFPWVAGASELGGRSPCRALEPTGQRLGRRWPVA